MGYIQVSKEEFVDWFNGVKGRVMDEAARYGIERYINFSITDRTMFSYYCCKVNFIDVNADITTLLWAEYDDVSFGIQSVDGLKFYIHDDNLSFEINLPNSWTFEGEFMGNY